MKSGCGSIERMCRINRNPRIRLLARFAAGIVSNRWPSRSFIKKAVAAGSRESRSAEIEGEREEENDFFLGRSFAWR